MQIDDNKDSNKIFTILPAESAFGQLLSKIKGHFFKPPPQVDPVIKLKASKLDKDASKILTNLMHVKTALKQQLDHETYGYLVRIIDPLAEDVKKMNGLLQKANQTEELSSVLHRYQQWMIKAKNWIGFGKEGNHSEHVVQVIVEHLLGELSASIDRDIRSILNYRSQILDSFEKEPPKSLYDEIIVSTEPHIGALNALKERQIHPKLEQFTEWKRWVNARRAVIFENALLVLEEYSQSNTHLTG